MYPNCLTLILIYFLTAIVICKDLSKHYDYLKENFEIQLVFAKKSAGHKSCKRSQHAKS